MSATLRVASSRRGYVLTDEATLARLAGAVTVQALYGDDPALLNAYAVAILTTARPARNEAADRFAQWLAEGDGQALIDAFRINGRPVFFRWPGGADSTTPESMPAGARQ
jgi:ABC-type tungstate transport system permease subunit